MEGRCLFLSLLALTLPSVIAQQCNILLVSEESENARFANVANENFDGLDNTFREFFGTLSAAGISQAGSAIFNQARTFVWNNPRWLTPSVLAAPTTPLPGRGSGLGGGAVVRDGVSQLLNDVISNPPTNRMSVAFVYASQLITFGSARSDVVTIPDDVQLLSAQGVDVYFFAIGSARDDPAFSSFEAAMNGRFSENRVFRVSNSGSVTDLPALMRNNILQTCVATPASTPAPTPAPTTLATTESRCEKCLIDESHPLIPHLTRCDRFIHCHRQGDAVIGIEKQCGPGTLFDEFLKVCNHADKVLANPGTGRTCNWCNRVSQTVAQRHPYQHSCAAYLECIINPATASTTLSDPKCCPLNQFFNELSGNCEVDLVAGASRCDRSTKHEVEGNCSTYLQCDISTVPIESCCGIDKAFDKQSKTCVDNVNGACSTGCGGQTTNTCPFILKDAAGCTFAQFHDGKEYPSQTCKPDMYFNLTTCACLPNEDGRGCISSRVATECQPDVIIDFAASGNQTKQEGFDEYANNRYVDVLGKPGFDGQDATLDGTNDYVLLKYYANNDMAYKSNVVFFRVHVKDDVPVLNNVPQPLNKEMIVLSNQPCPGESGKASVFITLQPAERKVVFGVVTKGGAEDNVTITYSPASRDAWKQLTLRYNQNGKLEGSVITYPGEVSSTPTIATQIENLQDDTTFAGGEIVHTSCGLKIGKGRDNQHYFQGKVDTATFYDDCPTELPPPAVNAAINN